MWKQLMLSLIVAICTISLSLDHAAALRLGGGRSIGMQRSTVRPRPAIPPTASPQQLNPAQPGTPMPQQSGWRRFAGPLAGLAAGLGLAALMSHFGMSGEFGGILLMVLAAMVVFALLRRFMSSQPAYANSNPGTYDRNQYSAQAEPGRLVSTQDAGQMRSDIPAGFDIEAFLHQAKVSFVRLQAANDSGNLEDIREFTSPEMFAEIKLAINERGGKPQRTDIVLLNAELLEVAQEGTRYIASVRYHGTLREDPNSAPQTIDEVWHLTKPVDGSRGWTLAGIQQVS